MSNIDLNNLSLERRNLIKLKRIGAMPNYIDCSIEISDKNDKVPFSKQYNTESDYIKDKCKALDFAERGEEIPEELYKRLLDTKEELENIK